jgi:hypothetical protein
LKFPKNSAAPPAGRRRGGLNRNAPSGDAIIAEGRMLITRTLAFSVVISAVIDAGAAPALAQACTRQGIDVICDDGRRGILSGDAIIWPDGTRSSLASPHPSVVIGNKSSVVVGQGVFVAQGKGVVPLDNPSAPNKARCPVLDGVSYCH